jgi:hypothetical protein
MQSPRRAPPSTVPRTVALVTVAETAFVRGRGRTALRALAALAVAGLGLMALGCGHPASREECQEIFDHSAEIELRSQNVSDPKVVTERIAAVRAARGEELIQQCLGKRITSSALACVRGSKTATEVDHCLD